MLLQTILAALVAAQTTSALPAVSTSQFKSRAVGFQWGTQKVRGVNLGGWLVLEPWITPSIFRNVDQSLGIVDEFTLCQNLPYQAASILRTHWDTWVSQQDFAKIASAGFNVVRIPIGFWAYDNAGTPYIQGAAPYIDAAVNWARSTGLHIIIDLHAAPGSQNGFDNSGQRTSNPIWLTDGGANGGTAQRTLAVLSTIAQKYAQPSYQDVIIGIELLNEPQGFRLNNNDLRQFILQGYNQVRNISSTPVIIQDAFLPPQSYDGFLTPADNAQNVAIDHHYYQIFSDSEVAMVPWQHRQAVCNNVHSYTDADKWTIIGEWTGAMTDCAPYLNGYGLGARYDGTYPNSTYHGSCVGKSDISSWNQTVKDDERGYIEAQIDAFESQAQGWIWWNFKTEAAHEWDLFILLDAGVFPNPVWSRKFGPVCSAYY